MQGFGSRAEGLPGVGPCAGAASPGGIPRHAPEALFGLLPMEIPSLAAARSSGTTLKRGEPRGGLEGKMVALGLTGLSVLLLVFSLWFFFGPDREPARPPAPLDPVPTLDPLGPFRYREPPPRPDALPRSLGTPCEECNGVALVWSRDPSGRPEAWLGICRRCGRVRVDAASGQVLLL